MIGGLDSGFYLGRECRAESKGEVVTATVVTIPDSEQKVEIQDQVTPTTAEVKKRCDSVGWGGEGGRGWGGETTLILLLFFLSSSSLPPLLPFFLRRKR